jgi:hypothetical protein
MNKRQAEAIVEFVQDGHTQEALLLAEAFNAPTEKVAAPKAVQFLTKTFQRAFQTLWNTNLMVIAYRYLRMVLRKEPPTPEEKLRLERDVNGFGMILMALLALVVFLISTENEDKYRAERNKSAFEADKKIRELQQMIQRYKRRLPA